MTPRTIAQRLVALLLWPIKGLLHAAYMDGWRDARIHLERCVESFARERIDEAYRKGYSEAMRSTEVRMRSLVDIMLLPPIRVERVEADPVCLDGDEP